MKITVLDGYALNPGDLSWDDLSAFGEVTVYDRTPADKTLERIGDSEIILTNKTKLPADIIKKSKNLKYIGVLATGYNVVDIKCANELGIVVTNIPTYASKSVAQHTMAFILNYANRVSMHSDSVLSGDWIKSCDFTYQLAPTMDLEGKTIGLIGYGAIAREVAKLAHAFGMRVLATTRRPFTDEIATCVGLSTLLKESDIVSLHCPLNGENQGMVDKHFLSAMKKSAVLINTARGGLVNETDLAEALNNGVIAAAAVDVISEEPMKSDNPLIGAANLTITPHNAWSSFEARSRLMNTAVQNIRQFINGTPVNTVK